jgi:hypothetical protein
MIRWVLKSEEGVAVTKKQNAWRASARGSAELTK